MLIVPEKHTIFILPPRTGSSSLHTAVRQTFPQSFMLYRHAERPAIPAGYESYRVLGFVRHPLARMWSLYKFLCCLDPATSATWVQTHLVETVEHVQKFKGFEDWLLHNDRPFLPKGIGHPGLYQQVYDPENGKSQWDYLRPDLGTEVLHFQDLRGWMEHWGLPAVHLNGTQRTYLPTLSRKGERHLEQFMEWELSLGLECV